MLIPLGTDRARTRPTVVNHALVVACALAFLGQTIAARISGGEAWIDAHLVLSRDAPVWTYLTYAFLHGNLAHIFFNLLFLWVFGPSVEDRLGRWWYLAFYLTGCAAAGLAHILASPAGVVGASGGVAAVTGAFLVLFPRTHIRTLVFFIIIGVFAIPSLWFIAFAIARDFLPFAIGLRDNVAREAHLGGYLFGAVVAFCLLATGVLPREPYDLFSILRQRRRRAALAEAVRTAERRSPVRRRPRDDRDEAPDPATDPAAEPRAEVSRRLNAGDAPGAARAYRALVEAFPDARRSTLAPSAQLDAGNAAFAQRDHEAAAWAYERYLGAYATQGDAPTVRLMLGLVYARYLARAGEARPLIERAREQLRDEAQRDLADQLLAELKDEP